MASTESSSLQDVFQENYNDFANDLLSTFPELTIPIQMALAIPAEERIAKYKEYVLRAHKPKSEDLVCPGQVLPYVMIIDSLWSAVTTVTKEAVYKYLMVLDTCVLMAGSNLFEEGSTESEDGIGKDIQDLLKNLTGGLGGLGGLNLESMTKKMAEMFGGLGGLGGGAASAEEGSSAAPEGFPSIPESFLKGKLAKLAEEMIREFKPEDFGLRPEDLQTMEANPMKAMEFLMNLTSSGETSEVLQKAMTRIAKKLKDKVQRGELRPQDLVAEAEDLIKEFQSNPKFVNIMETFRSMFNFEDPDMARAAGREGEARRSIVQQRLRKKLEERRAGKKK